MWGTEARRRGRDAGELQGALVSLMPQVTPALAILSAHTSLPTGIARLVSEAQSREAPVQRLADAVAGRFCYGVMAASAATFAFWSTLGVSMFPDAIERATFAGVWGYNLDQHIPRCNQAGEVCKHVLPWWGLACSQT